VAHFQYGADAVYTGMLDMSMRKKSAMTFDDLKAGIDFVHANGKRIYLAFNIFSHNSDMPKLQEAADNIQKLGPDGLIISDPAVFMFMKNALPDMPLHVSTQANVCSWGTVKFWEQQGAKMCVLGREVSFPELLEIREKCPDIKLEMFVHGAMCISYSGRCLLSNFMTGRGANQGNCAQSCRWNYKVHAKIDGKMVPVGDASDEAVFYLEEEQRPGQFLPIAETERGSYIMSSKDMCLLPKLPELMEANVECWKIEGRNKAEYYVAVTARAYRAAIDAYMADPENFDATPYMEELMTLQHRDYTLGFFEGVPDGGAQTYETTKSDSDWRTIGIVTSIHEDGLIMELRNQVIRGDEIQLLSPMRFEPYTIPLTKVIDSRNGQAVEKLAAGHEKSILLPWDILPENASALFPELTVARKKIN